MYRIDDVLKKIISTETRKGIPSPLIMFPSEGKGDCSEVKSSADSVRTANKKRCSICPLKDQLNSHLVSS